MIYARPGVRLPVILVHHSRGLDTSLPLPVKMRGHIFANDITNLRSPRYMTTSLANAHRYIFISECALTVRIKRGISRLLGMAMADSLLITRCSQVLHAKICFDHR